MCVGNILKGLKYFQHNFYSIQLQHDKATLTGKYVTQIHFLSGCNIQLHPAMSFKINGDGAKVQDY